MGVHYYLHALSELVVGAGDPIPEVGALHALSELMVGREGVAPDPRDGDSTKTQGIGMPSFSRTVSFPYEDSDLHSFNANALGCHSGGEIADDNILPSGGGRDQLVIGRGGAGLQDEENDEFSCRLFVDSDSELDSDSDE